VGGGASRDEPDGKVRNCAEGRELDVGEPQVSTDPPRLTLEVAAHLDPSTRPEPRGQRERHGGTRLADGAQRRALDREHERPPFAARIGVVPGAAVDLRTRPGDTPAGAAPLLGGGRFPGLENARQGNTPRIAGEPDFGLPEDEFPELHLGRRDVGIEPLELQRAQANAGPPRFAYRQVIGADLPAEPAFGLLASSPRVVLELEVDDARHLARRGPDRHEVEGAADVDMRRGELGPHPFRRPSSAKAATEYDGCAVQVTAQSDGPSRDAGRGQGSLEVEAADAHERCPAATRLEAQGGPASVARVEGEGRRRRWCAGRARCRRRPQRQPPAPVGGAQPDACAVERQVSDAEAAAEHVGEVNAHREAAGAERRPASVRGHARTARSRFPRTGSRMPQPTRTRLPTACESRGASRRLARSPGASATVRARTPAAVPRTIAGRLRRTAAV